MTTKRSFDKMLSQADDEIAAAREGAARVQRFENGGAAWYDNDGRIVSVHHVDVSGLVKDTVKAHTGMDRVCVEAQQKSGSAPASTTVAIGDNRGHKLQGVTVNKFIPSRAPLVRERPFPRI
ncbi:MAG: hypothetical protein AB7G06_05485 [Bdellovibrionales bacterium]